MKGNIAIVGLGLIGGSLARAIKKGYPNATIIGVDDNEETRRLSKTLKIVEEVHASILEEDFPTSEIDILFLCTPVSVTCKILQELKDLPLKENVIVTDTGSVKQVVLQSAMPLIQSGVCYIGGHPMAGSHKSGILASKEHLFENAYYLLTTPFDTYYPERVAELVRWLEPTKAKFIQTTERKHDQVTALISHFPHMIASSLVHQVKKHSETLPDVTKLAAGGFRDITRIASSNPIMWRDITFENRVILAEQLDTWMKEMHEWKDLLLQENPTSIEEYFSEAKEFRDNMPIYQETSETPFFDLFVDVPDYPGVISEVTKYLAEQSISLTNIRIMETREDIFGILVITFSSYKERERAYQCLKQKTNYELICST
ncbi:prephenate dehydrogenase [Mangrovibacillus cuniculi]|uniref:Prephenate dehydrogenase n=1 Tax=Mangrovibacillus cuniculi TaxID=2593652 RepID=A0A7S8CBE1_9BACI|nr:prephenate dehydrogenase [Mangrovibacillus cuniculi]QPC46693.1 prephenate dehydrogenase [Mangrovibacillus cuniculi]